MVDTLLLCVFWVVVGYGVMLPVLLAQAVYNNARSGAVYDIGGVYILQRKHNKRELKRYIVANATLLAILAVLAAI